MLVEERRQRVLDLVSKRGFVALADLARAIQVSESTIRRDLDELQEKGLLRRTHGGAIYLGGQSQGGNGDGRAGGAAVGVAGLDAPLPALEERASSQLEEK